MTVHLCPQTNQLAGIGDDTFWCWMTREFETAVGNPGKIPDGDQCLWYASREEEPPDGAICLLWELYVEMREKLGSSQWDRKIQTMLSATAKCRRKVVGSPLVAAQYPQLRTDVIPIGVDTDLFKPLSTKRSRQVFAHMTGTSELQGDVGFWGGTTHQMKGFDRLVEYAKKNRNITWILAWKHPREVGNGQKAGIRCVEKYFPQRHLPTAINCADFFLVTGRLSPFFLLEWECCACNLFPVNVTSLEKELPGIEPRKELIEAGWAREDAKAKWEAYLSV